MVRGDELVIRPIKTVAGGEFAEQILSDLIKEGLSGEELLTEFKSVKLRSDQLQKQCSQKQRTLPPEKQNMQLTKMSLERRTDLCCQCDLILRQQSILKS